MYLLEGLSLRTVIARALAKVFQPCHRYDLARSEICVPSPRRRSTSLWVSLLLLLHSNRYMTPPSIFIRTSSGLGEFWCSQPWVVVLPFVLIIVFGLDTAVNPSGLRRLWLPPLQEAPWVRISPGGISASAILSAIKDGLVSWFPFPPHRLTSPASYSHPFTTSHHFYYPSPHTTSLPTMSSIYDGYDTNDFYCEGRSDPSIDIGVRYYPDRDQWSPVFNPNVVPDHDAVGDKAPIDSVGDKDPVDVKPTVNANEKGPAEATVDPASINTILPSELACSASLVYIPKGMEIIETRTHYYPLKDKWHAINDPSRHYDCVPIPRLFPKPHPFVCVPWSVHDPELPPGLPVPFLCTLNLPVPAPTPAPSQPSSSESSSNDSDSSSTYPLISNYINLNHQGVQKLLLDDNTPPTAVCIYTEEDVMRIFEGIAPEYVDMCSEYPPSSLAESDRRVMFFENMQWFFRNKRSTYLSTRKF
ncbi:hypothetical protein PGT21_006202 [Puccinia graminis f. sp. tritici]|uniref:Uncharacterized protein n=1 Tax=Puccinia graminis f. sp. tritici TaxID=56615 RepID=A0A5B0R0H4_PUCGR|nr:hypothetical protein PGT21_006202 [Puccinia graminis f. sp. tritici]